MHSPFTAAGLKVKLVLSRLCPAAQDDEAALLEGDKEGGKEASAAAARTAMEKTLAGPSAAHPTEGYGSANLSLAQVLYHI